MSAPMSAVRSTTPRWRPSPPHGALSARATRPANGQAPRLQDWAEQDARSSPSDEFASKTKTDNLLETDKTRFAEVDKLGHVVIPANSNLSDQDGKAGEF